MFQGGWQPSGTGSDTTKVPYTGATANVDLGSYDLTANDITSTGKITGGSTGTMVLNPDAASPATPYIFGTKIPRLSGKLASIYNSLTEMVYIGSDGLINTQGQISATGSISASANNLWVGSYLLNSVNVYALTCQNTSTPLTLASYISDGANAVAVRTDTSNALTTSGAKIHQFNNQGVEKAYIDKDGRYVSKTTYDIASDTSYTYICDFVGGKGSMYWKDGSAPPIEDYTKSGIGLFGSSDTTANGYWLLADVNYTGDFDVLLKTAGKTVVQSAKSTMLYFVVLDTNGTGWGIGYNGSVAKYVAITTWGIGSETTISYMTIDNNFLGMARKGDNLFPYFSQSGLDITAPTVKTYSNAVSYVGVYMYINSGTAYPTQYFALDYILRKA